MTPQNIAIERAAWLQALCADKSVKLEPLRVGVIIGNHINGVSGEAWPSQATIAAILSMSRQHVNRAVSSLVSAGYLSVRKSGQENYYRMTTRTSPGTGNSPDTRPSPGNSFHIGQSPSPGNEPVPCQATNPSLARDTICEEQRINSEGRALSARPYDTESDGSSVEMPATDAAMPPKAARLHGRMVATIEQTFGRPLLAHHQTEFVQLVEQIGQRAVYARLAAYREQIDAGAEAMPLARWLRRSGLRGISNAA